MQESDVTRYLLWAFTAVLLYSMHLVMGIVLPPFDFPRSIPTIPFYVAFLGVFTKMDQEEIYNRYMREKMERFGAVKLYFASRWNIIVTRPDYLLEIFRNDDIYSKSGNQKKIPNSVLADYTGDNIISAHGATWKAYRDIVSASIQFPNLAAVQTNCDLFLDILSKEVVDRCNPLPVTELLQKYTLANVGHCILGINFGTLNENRSELHERINYVKKQIFNPLFLNFPYLDSFPFPSRKKARKEVKSFREYFGDIIKTGQHVPNKWLTGSDHLVLALQEGLINEKQFMDNAIILMVAGHENPLLLLLSLFFVIAKHEDVQDKIRKEIMLKSDESTYLNSVIYECVRMYPPLGQIVNRLTTRNVTLGKDIKIPKGTYVGYNNFGTGRSANVWGPDADKFRPERWGDSLEEINKKYASSKRSAALPAFHGRKRACLGEKFALFEVKALLQKVLLAFKISLDPNWEEKLTPVGPICPWMLSVQFESLKKPKKNVD
ncbi:cytochrome P450 [Scheffersomyces xylosifermentans]|uniref:cytochrome P450 n=1 Tax=Scheffersomyces xylosifermentans TaxID=1304137 RepID=UPI00315DB4F0